MYIERGAASVRGFPASSSSRQEARSRGSFKINDYRPNDRLQVFLFQLELARVKWRDYSATFIS